MHCDFGGEFRILLYFHAAIVLALHLEVYFFLENRGTQCEHLLMVWSSKFCWKMVQFISES